jgi:carbon-monoxide dehydrogenase medium subunit
LAAQGPQAFVLAGGTDILVRLRRNLMQASALVNIKRIPDLDKIVGHADGGLSIGALCKIEDIAQSELVRRTHPLLAQAAGTLGSAGIRNLATIGGNVGRASPASDVVPALMALAARVSVAERSGVREIDVDGVCLGPGSTCLPGAAIMTRFALPPQTGPAGGFYYKQGRREGMDLAIAGAAAALTLDASGRRAARVGLVLSAVAPVPLRAVRAEEVLRSGDLSAERIAAAADAAAAESRPCCDLRATDVYRVRLVRTIARRAIEAAFRQARRNWEAM